MPGSTNEVPNDAAGLSEELKEIAYRELGETPEIKREALDQLRKLLSDDPLLHSPTDDAFFTKFLRARKYDVGKAFKNIQKYFQARKNQPDMFVDLNPSSIPFDVVCRKHQLVTFSNGRDPDGIPAVVLKVGRWNSDICSLTDYFRVCAVHVGLALLDEEVQIKGAVVVWDMKDLSLYHLTHYTPAVSRRLLNFVQDCFPLRVKAVYVTNNPVIFDIMLALAKPFMKSKLMQRFHLLGYNVEKLRSLVPADLIPEASGGTYESYDYDEIERRLHSRADVFLEMSNYGYQDAMKLLCETQ
ncbi:alpha-tocopherol transfer protein-like [Haemaphysalis longicornis]